LGDESGKIARWEATPPIDFFKNKASCLVEQKTRKIHAEQRFSINRPGMVQKSGL
jgi:hypothetical protein